MPRSGVLFGNKRIIKPGVYSKMDAKGSIARDFANQKTIIILGTSEGGEPSVLKWFNDPNQAIREYKGGDIADAVALLYNTARTGMGEGAGTIGIVRTNEALKSSANLGSWGKVTSKDYGQYTNTIKIGVFSGVLGNSKTITVTCDRDQAVENFANVGAVFKVKSSEEQAQIEIKDKSSDVVAEIKVGNSLETAGEISINDPRILTLRRFAEYVSSVSSGKITLELQEETSANTETKDLDKGTYRKDEFMLAMKSEISGRLEESNYVNLEITGAIDNISMTALTGGSDGLSAASWKKHYETISAANCSIVVPLTSDKVIIAEALAHANFMSNEKAKERIVISGMEFNETSSNAIKLATMLGNSRIQLIPQSATVRINGGIKRVPGYLVACLQAGRCSFIDNGESTTFSYFPIVKLDKEYTEDEVDNMIKAGCTLFEASQQGVRCVQDITTYTDSEESLYTERAVIMLSDEINKELRARLEDLQIGKKGLRSTAETVKNAVISFLKDKIRKEEITSYRNITVTSHNRVVTVDYEVAPVEPTNYILITGHFFTEETITA